MKDALQHTICPVCRTELIIRTTNFHCSKCKRDYPVIHGIPILLKEENSVIFETTSQKSASKIRIWFQQLLQKKPDMQCSTATQANVKYLSAHLHPESLLLFVGGGINSFGKYMQELGPSILSRSINLEISTGPVVDIVADGHDIPFPDNFFEAIICQAVLEHTRDSRRVVSEMHRILKPNGVIYVEIPFLAPVHMTSDFRRYTLKGMQELFSAFDTIHMGVNGSVASAFAMISVNFFATLFSFDNSSLYHLGRFLFSWLFAPVKYLDWIFYKYSTSSISASAVYFLGSKNLVEP